MVTSKTKWLSRDGGKFNKPIVLPNFGYTIANEGSFLQIRGLALMIA